MSDAEHADSGVTDRETIEGLWRALMRYVPRSKQDEAYALARVLDYLLTTDTIERRRQAERAAYAQGVAAGEQSGRSAAGFAYRRAALEYGVVLDEVPPELPH